MKILYTALIVILILVALVLATLYTSFGNSVVKSYAQSYIDKNLAYKIKIDEFVLLPSNLTLKIRALEDIDIDMNGKVSLFSRKFDLLYTVKSAKNHLDMKGDIVGGLNDFKINANGKAAGSDGILKLWLKDKKIHTLIVDAPNLNISDLLGVAGIKEYVNGHINAFVDMKLASGLLEGNGHITGQNLNLNNALIKKDFNLTLPQNSAIKFRSDIFTKEWKIYTKTTINSPLMSANSKEMIYDINSSVLRGNFELNIPNLAAFESILKQKLLASLDASGDFEINKNKLAFINSVINGLGGSVSAKFDGKNLNAQIKNINLKDSLVLALKPPFADGKIDGYAQITNLDDIKNLNGNLKLDISKASLMASELNLIKNLPFTASLNANLNSGKSVLKADISSKAFSIDNVILNYDLVDKNGELNAKARSGDLEYLREFSGKKLSKNLDLTLLAKFSKNSIKADIKGRCFGGDIAVNYDDTGAKIEAKSLGLSDVLLFLNQPNFATAKLDLNANLSDANPNNLAGEVLATLKDGVLDREVCSKISGKNFDKNIKFSGNFSSKIKNSIANFDLNLLSELANLTKFSGDFNLKTKVLAGDYLLDIADLSRLNTIFGQKLQGALKLYGKANFTNLLSLSINSDDFSGGILKSNLKDQKFKADVRGVNLKKLTHMLSLGYFYDGNANLELSFDTILKSGIFNALIDEGRFAKTSFTSALSALFGRDLTTIAYKNSTVVGTIKGDIIKFDANMSAPKSTIQIDNGKVDTKSGALDIIIDANVEKTDLRAIISGTTKEPKYSVKSEYLKNKIEKELGRGIKRLLGSKDENATQNDVQKTNELINGLRGLF